MSGLVRLHLSDNIAIATERALAGTNFTLGSLTFSARQEIPQGHKVALQSIAAGEMIVRYGSVIGRATQPIVVGDHVHSHNLVHDHQMALVAESIQPPPAPPPILGRTFQGFKRADGRVGTRNYVAIVSTVNCSASVAHVVSRSVGAELLSRFEHVDGIVPIAHEGGCAMEYGGLKHQMLARVLVGLARHPNVGACILIGLGCEQGTVGYLSQNHGLVSLRGPSGEPLGQHCGEATIPVFSIQDEGGYQRTIDRCLGVIKDSLAEANRASRTTCDARHLMVGLECGGSDGFSGITANPALGAAADRIVACGGTAILSETTEIYGAEHLLVARSRSLSVAQRLLDRIRWWHEYAGKYGVELDNNPSVGNKAGGLTTIAEKSLGAVAKGGTTALEGVFEYAQRINQAGFVVMDTPGFDPASVTGMMAGGANLIVFTTGRGSCFGSKPAPTIKVASNDALFERLHDDMDFNAGPIASQGITVEQAGAELFEMILRVASGETTKSERQGIGDHEIVPWTVGPTL
jgi:altronate hydrolase